ncbi:DUF5803 family protein [Methanimicrococcus hacksteinii]|nr:DUF5803 family protein [Methanimicrococcus sp. At1]
MFLILIAVSLSGCLTALTGEQNSAAEAEDIAGVLEIYELNVFIPTVKGAEKVVDSGTYFVSNTPATKVVLFVNNQNEISLLRDSGLLSFDAPVFEHIYFITAENTENTENTEDFSATPEGIKALIENPVLTDVSYTLKDAKNSPTLKLEENFTGVLVYTFIPQSGGTSVLINDKADAVQVILPEGMTTGNRIIGKASPNPDSAETDGEGRNVLKWNNPIGNISVKYYSEKAPLYLIIAFSALIAAIALVYLWYRYQIKKLHKITELIDDETSGFRKQN